MSATNKNTKTYTPLVFRVRALTNVHAGGGDSFYGAVDKLVQRDAATNLPTIYGHSMKGAIREYFEDILGNETGSVFIKHAFGSPVKSKPEDAQPGEYRFFAADLVAIPVPDKGPSASVQYHLVTQASIWEGLADKIGLLGGSMDAGNLRTAFNNGLPVELADETAEYSFKETADELPVVARNQLNNGESENLWYEELVPRESLFAFVVQVDANSTEFYETFISNLDGKVVQIGGNATVGYGYCLFTLVSPKPNTAS
jgi:CRISPR-associated protein Cmr4